MTTRLALALGASAVLVPCLALLPAAASGQTRGAKACPPISVEVTLGTFTYTVWVEAGRVSCATARAVVRDATGWPPEQDAEAGWGCAAGQDPASWAISCSRGTAVVRAYGPVRERNPWVIAQARERLGLLAPTSTLGFVLRSLRVRRCDTKAMMAIAKYARADGATVTIYEGRPYVCGDLGLVPRLATWRIHGQPATLRELCDPTGCARLWGDYALDWHEHGLGIDLFTHSLRQGELLAIARSVAIVPA